MRLIRRRLAGADDGFTLIELLVTIVVVGIVIVPFSAVVIGYLRNSAATAQRLNESHDVQLANAYFARDVASLGTRVSDAPTALLGQSVWVNIANGTGTFPCGSSGTAIVELVWDDQLSTGTTTLGYHRVAYTVREVNGERQLRRLVCAGSAAVVSDTVIAHNVDASTDPSLTCDTTCTGSGAAVPRQLTLTLAVRDPDRIATTTDPNYSPAYVVSLIGLRRTT